MSLATSLRRGFGVFESTGPLGTDATETYTCAHCNQLSTVDPEKGPPICLKEWLPICIPCHRKNECMPFEKKLDVFERKVQTQLEQDRFYRSLGL